MASLAILYQNHYTRSDNNFKLSTTRLSNNILCLDMSHHQLILQTTDPGHHLMTETSSGSLSKLYALPPIISSLDEPLCFEHDVYEMDI